MEVFLVFTNGGRFRTAHTTRKGAEKWIADDLELYGYRNDSAYHWIATVPLREAE